MSVYRALLPAVAVAVAALTAFGLAGCVGPRGSSSAATHSPAASSQRTEVKTNSTPSAPATTLATPTTKSSLSPAMASLASLGKAPTVATIGDSIMAGLGLDSSQNWPAVIASEDKITVTNLACSGAGFIAIGNCGNNFAGLISQAVDAKPNIVIIESSSNDLGQADSDIDTATTQTVAQLHQALPKTVIIGLSTIWNEQPDVPHEVVSSSSALQSAVEAVGGIYFDIGQPLLNHPEWMQDDDVHPTADGQVQIASVVRSALVNAGFPL